MPEAADRVLRAARRAADIAPFEVMEILARAHALESAGRRVVHMEIGEPDFTAAPAVVDAAARAMRDGLTAYTAALGLPSLREAIAAFYLHRLGVRVDPARIAVTAGASGGLLVALAALVDPGNEVLVPDPGYPAYRHFVRAFEGVARPLEVGAGDRFQPTLGGVQAAWRERTAGLIIGSPSNPTGTTIPRAELERIAGFAAARGGFMVVDEIYQGLTYGEPSATAADLGDNIIVVNSFSKYFCMTGWRLGWVVLPPALVRSFEKLAQHMFICPSAVSQHGALAAFEPETIALLEVRRREFEARRDFLVPALARLGLPAAASPTGAFYVYADCSRYGPGKAFALELLDRAGVAATPGIDFGAHGTGSTIRFAYTRSMPDLEEAMRRIEEFAG
jgi:aspartate/methionine/tyrosine aminotransferase